MVLQVGFFEAFKLGWDTLLLWGDEDGLSRLLALLREVAASKHAVALHKLPWVLPLGGVEVELTAGRRSDVRIQKAGPAVEWFCTADDLRDHADRVASLIASSDGHQYLDSSSSVQPLQIMVSKGEYPADLGRS